MIRSKQFAHFNIAGPGGGGYVTVATVPGGVRWKLIECVFLYVPTGGPGVVALAVDKGDVVAFIHYDIVHLHQHDKRVERQTVLEAGDKLVFYLQAGDIVAGVASGYEFEL